VDYSRLPRFPDVAPYACRFTVRGVAREWVQYHPTPAAAEAALLAAVSREYGSRASGVVVVAV
jgi:hypothetical protein